MKQSKNRLKIQAFLILPKQATKCKEADIRNLVRLKISAVGADNPPGRQSFPRWARELEIQKKMPSKASIPSGLSSHVVRAFSGSIALPAGEKGFEVSLAGEVVSEIPNFWNFHMLADSATKELRSGFKPRNGVAAVPEDRNIVSFGRVTQIYRDRILVKVYPKNLKRSEVNTLLLGLAKETATYALDGNKKRAGKAREQKLTKVASLATLLNFDALQQIKENKELNSRLGSYLIRLQGGDDLMEEDEADPKQKAENLPKAVYNLILLRWLTCNQPGGYHQKLSGYEIDQLKALKESVDIISNFESSGLVSSQVRACLDEFYLPLVADGRDDELISVLEGILGGYVYRRKERVFSAEDADDEISGEVLASRRYSVGPGFGLDGGMDLKRAVSEVQILGHYFRVLKANLRSLPVKNWDTPQRVVLGDAMFREIDPKIAQIFKKLISAEFSNTPKNKLSGFSNQGAALRTVARYLKTEQNRLRKVRNIQKSKNRKIAQKKANNYNLAEKTHKANHSQLNNPEDSQETLPFLTKRAIEDQFQKMIQRAKFDYKDEKKLSLAKKYDNAIKGRGMLLNNATNNPFLDDDEVGFPMLPTQNRRLRGPTRGTRNLYGLPVTDLSDFYGTNRRFGMERDEDDPMDYNFENSPDRPALAPEAEDYEAGMTEDMTENESGLQSLENKKKRGGGFLERMSNFLGGGGQKKGKKKKRKDADPTQESDKAKKKREEEQKKRILSRFMGRFSGNIFLIDLQEAFYLLDGVKEWLDAQDFRFNLLKRVRKRRSRKSRKLKFKFETVVADAEIKEKVWAEFVVKYRKQLEEVQRLQFGLKFDLAKISDLLSFGDKRLKELCGFPRIHRYLISCIKFERIEQLLDIKKPKKLNSKKSDEVPENANRGGRNTKKRGRGNASRLTRPSDDPRGQEIDEEGQNGENGQNDKKGENGEKPLAWLDRIDPSKSYKLTTSLLKLLQSPKVCKEYSKVSSTLFTQLKRNFYNESRNVVWLYSQVIQKSLIRVDARLRHQNRQNRPNSQNDEIEDIMDILPERNPQGATFSIDRDYIPTLIRKIPFKTTHPEFFKLLRILFPPEIETEEREMKLLENIINDQSLATTSSTGNKDSWYVLESLFRLPWVKTNNLKMLLYKYLERYSEKHQAGSAWESPGIMKMATMADRDFNLIDEVFGFQQTGLLGKTKPRRIRISLQKLSEAVEGFYPIEDFGSIYIQNRRFGGKERGSGISQVLNLLNIKYLQCLTRTLLGKNVDSKVKQFLRNKGSESSYLRFFSRARAYIEQINSRNIPVSGLFNLRTFMRNSFAQDGLADEVGFLCHLFGLSNVNKHSLLTRIRDLDQNLHKFEKTLSNAKRRLALLSYITADIRRATNNALAYFDNVEVSKQPFSSIFEKKEYKIALLFEKAIIDFFPDLKTYRSFTDHIDRQIVQIRRSNKSQGRVSLSQFINVFERAYVFFQAEFKSIPTTATIDKFDKYLRAQVDTQSRVRTIGTALGLPGALCQKIAKTATGFHLVEKFWELYPHLKSYCDKFGLADANSTLGTMKEYYNGLKAVALTRPQQDRSALLENLTAGYIDYFYRDVASNETMIAFLNRFAIVILMDKYSDFLVYIKEKGEIFFESIRTEVDESQVEDFNKVVSVQRHLGAAMREKSLRQFIRQISKPKMDTIRKLVESLRDAGPKLDSIKETANRANQSSSNDFENITEIIKKCSVEFIYGLGGFNTFIFVVKFSKNSGKSQYRFKEFQELFKKGQILKDSELRDGAADQAGEADDLTKNVHSEFVVFGSKIMKLLKILREFKKIGLIDNNFTEISHTFKDFDQEYLNFTADNSTMTINYSEEEKDFLDNLHEQLSHLYEKCREEIYAKYRDSEYTNLTYFYGKRLYDLAKYFLQEEGELPQVRELFKEISPDYDPRVNAKKSKIKHLNNLDRKIETLSQFLKVDKFRQKRNFELSDPVSQENKVAYYLNFNQQGAKNFDLMNLVIYIKETHGVRLIKGSNILLCSKHSSHEEITAFCYRSLYSKSSGIFYVLNPENLDKDRFNLLRSTYETILESKPKSASANVIFIMSRPNLDYSSSLMKSQHFCKYLRKIREHIDDQETLTKLELVTVVHSEYAGLGKTTYIKKRSGNTGLVVLFLTGELSVDVLDRRLENLERVLSRNSKSTNLHIKLDTLEELEHSNGIVDYLLFQICFLKRVQTRRGCLDLRKINQIYIEVGNTLGIGLLAQKFSTLTLYNNRWIQMKPFRIRDLIYNRYRDSMEQRVAFFLKMIEDKLLQHCTIQNQQVYSEADYQAIMAANFMKGEFIRNRDAITYTQFSTWLKICHTLFMQMEKVEDLKPEVSSGAGNVRLELGKVIRDFASKLIQFSVEQAKSNQSEFYFIKKNYEAEKRKIEEMHRKYENMVKWNASEYLIPFIRNGKFMVFYKEEKLFKNLTSLKFLVQNKMSKIRSHKKVNMNATLKSNEYLKIYETLYQYKKGELVERAKKFPNIEENCDNESGVDEGYVMTEENNIKSALMLVKSMIGDPIVIMGQSGCGKTYFTKFTASCIQKDEIRVLTLHAGVKETSLLKFMKDCISRAKDLKNTGDGTKKLWILFDEFNTSPLQSIVAEIMQDKTCSIDCSIEDIPDNMVFVACCNPFQLRQKKSELGLIPDTAENRLSHKVYIVLESLLNYVWDFGQLTEKDEKDHINSIISSENIFGGESSKTKKDNTNFLFRCVFQAHKFVRKNEDKSGVSLRDIKRVTTIMKWSLDYMQKVKGDLDYKKKKVLIVAVVLTLNICYGVRMNGMMSKTPKLAKKNKTMVYEMLDQVYRDCICSFVKIKKKKFEAKKLLAMVNEVESHFLSKLDGKDCIPAGIAMNKPLRENIFTLLACYSTLTPLLICGKPGTSKTLCAQIFSTALKPEVSSKIKSLVGLPNSIELYYGGSQTSTDTGIQKVFDRADKIIKADKEVEEDHAHNNHSSRKRPLILIDEIGLAELSPHNPLKILHPKLEKKDKEYAFLGISNWALDLSKMNRVVYLARPDMNFEDLQDTFVSITGLSYDRCNGLMSDFIEAYLGFRRWQMKHAGHKNFHGSRDIYSVFKHIKSRVSVFKDAELSDERLISILKGSIERNFSGALYKIDKTQKQVMKGSKGSAKEKRVERFVSLSRNPGMEPRTTPGGLKLENAELSHEQLERAQVVEQGPQTTKINFLGNLKYNSDKMFLRVCQLKNLYNKWNLMGESVENYYYESSSQLMKRILIQESNYMKQASPEDITKFYYDENSFNDIKRNLRDNESRFLLLFTENGVIDEILVELIKSEFPKREIIDWRGSKLNSTNTEKETVEMLSMMKTYIQNGYIVVMKNINELFGSLYDLFNQKYFEREGNKYCNLYYGDEKPRAMVHPDFKCIVIIGEDEGLSGAQAEISQPAPFLNRFEKYRLRIVDVLRYDQIHKLKEILKMGSDMSRGLESRLVCFNIEMLSSIIMTAEVDEDNPFAEQRDVRKVYMERLNRLTTSNYLLSQGKSVNKLKVAKFKQYHPYDSLVGLMSAYHKSLEKKIKTTVFTFSSTFSLEKCLKVARQRSADQKDALNLDAWTVVNSFELEKAGTANRKNMLEKSSKDYILIQFQKRSHLQMIPSIKSILDKMMLETAEEDRTAENTNKGVLKGVILLVHITNDDNFDQDMKNTGLSFWNNWENYVIEDIIDSGYSTIDRYFFIKTQTRSQTTGKIVEKTSFLVSLHKLLLQNHGLRVRLFQKYLLKIFREVDEDLPLLGIEAEMSQISYLLNEEADDQLDGGLGQRRQSFIHQFSEILLQVDSIKQSLEDRAKAEQIFVQCQRDLKFFHYEDKLMQVMTDDIKHFFIRVLVEIQMAMRFSSICRMVKIFPRPEGGESRAKMLNLVLRQIQGIVASEAAKTGSKVTKTYYRRKNFGIKTGSSKGLLPFSHFPFVAQTVSEVVKAATAADDPTNSLIKELKELIHKMMLDSEFCQRETVKDKYDKLKALIRQKISEIIGEKVAEISQQLKRATGSTAEKKMIQKYVVIDLVNEFFRLKSKKKWVNPNFNILLANLIQESIPRSRDLGDLITDCVYFIRIYENHIEDLNTLVSQLRVKVTLEDLQIDKKSSKLPTRGAAYLLIKEIKNSILTKLVFDTKNEKERRSIRKILENIEIVEYLDFKNSRQRNGVEEVTTKENVKILRVLLNFLLLIKKAQGLASEEEGFLNNNESIEINSIFEQSKSAYNPNKYRFQQFQSYFYSMVNTYTKVLETRDQKEEFVNLTILFNEIVFRMIFRLKGEVRKVKKDENKYHAHIRSAFSILLKTFLDKSTSEIFNSLLEPKLVHKMTNHLANCIYQLVEEHFSVDVVARDPMRWVQHSNTSLTEGYFIEFLDRKIVDPSLNVSLNELSDHENIQIALAKSLADVYTKNYEVMIQTVKDTNMTLYRSSADLLIQIILKSGSQETLDFHLQKIKSIAFVRAYMNYDFCDNFKDFVLRKPFEDKITDKIIISTKGDENIAATFVKGPYVNIFYLMNNFNMVYKEGLIEDGADLNKSNKIVHRFVDITSPKKAKYPIVLRDQNLRKLQEALVQHYEKSKLQDDADFLKSVKEIREYTSSPSLFKYILGVVLLNILTKSEDEGEDDAADRQKGGDLIGDNLLRGTAAEIESGKKTDIVFMKKFIQNDSYLNKNFDQTYLDYLVTLVNKDYKELNRFNTLPNYAEFLKIVMHFGLLLVSFPSKNHKFEWNDGMWKNNEINATLIHPYPEEFRFTGLLSKLIFVHETRMKESGFDRYYKDIGIYECSCGLSYSLQDCGMASVEGKCTNCGATIGGKGHKHSDRVGHFHYKALPELAKRIKQLYEKHKNKYYVTRCLSHNSDDYKNYDYLEGKKDRNFRILSHLFDHMFLILYPIVQKSRRTTIQRKYANFFNNDSLFRKEIKKLNNIEQKDYIDYFLSHILFDLEQVKLKCRITIKDTIILLNEAMVVLGEEMGRGRVLQEVLRNSITGSKNMFSETNRSLTQLKKRLDEYQKEEISVEKKALDLAMKRLDKRDIRRFFPQHYKNLLLYRNFPKVNLMRSFSDKLKEFGVSARFPFLNHFMNNLEVFPLYKDIVHSHIDLVNCLNAKLGSKYTKEQARQKTVREVLEETGDDELDRKYAEFQRVWEDVIPPIKEKHGAMFNIAFMCQRNLDPDAYFKKLTDPEQLTLMELILINSDTNEGIFLLGTIQTLLGWQQNMLTKAREALNRPSCPSKVAMDAAEEDYLTEIDYESIVRANTFFNLEFNKDNQIRFDIHKIEQDIAERIIRDKYILEFEKDKPDCIRFYKFFGEFSEDEHILAKVIPRLKTLKLPVDLRDQISKLGTEKLQKMKNFISSLCFELFNQVIYDEKLTVRKVVSELRNLMSFDISLIENVRLGHLSGILDLIRISKVDADLVEKGSQLSKKLSSQTRVQILQYLHEENGRGVDVTEKIVDVITEVKLGLFECFAEESRYQQLREYNLLDLISITTYDDFSEWLTASNAIEAIQGVQVLDFLHVLKKAYDQSL